MKHHYSFNSVRQIPFSPDYFHLSRYSPISFYNELASPLYSTSVTEFSPLPKTFLPYILYAFSLFLPLFYLFLANKEFAWSNLVDAGFFFPPIISIFPARYKPQENDFLNCFKSPSYESPKIDPSFD